MGPGPEEGGGVGQREPHPALPTPRRCAAAPGDCSAPFRPSPFLDKRAVMGKMEVPPSAGS